MIFDAETSVTISFVLFVILFAIKVYPVVVGYLDEYIESVRTKINNAEKSERDAQAQFALANKEMGRVAESAEEIRVNSDKKIQIIREEHEKYLRELEIRQDAIFNSRFEAESSKQKNELISRLSDLIVDRLADDISKGKSSKFSVKLNSKDLEKLV